MYRNARNLSDLIVAYIVISIIDTIIRHCKRIDDVIDDLSCWMIHKHIRKYAHTSSNVILLFIL